MGRLTNKRSDRRWKDDEGNVWASKLELDVFQALRRDARITVRRCSAEEGDTFAYTSKVRSASCATCGSTEVVQRRTYTPDLYVCPSDEGGEGRGYYLEVKGHFPGPRRKLIGDFLKTGPSIDLRILLAAGGAHRAATPKRTLFEYCIEVLKRPTHTWDGTLPRPWIEGEI